MVFALLQGSMTLINTVGTILLVASIVAAPALEAAPWGSRSKVKAAEAEARAARLDAGALAFGKAFAEYEAKRLAAEKAQAQQEAEHARAEAAQAKVDREVERQAARELMRKSLSRIAETRQSVRGVIVNLPEIVFDFDNSQLRPQAKETLSRICGVLSVARGYNLSIEGHTDNIGPDDYNRQLSRQRAQSVERYFNDCRLPDVSVVAQGLGESAPIAGNDTNDGRRQNRRVEIVIEDSNSFELGMSQR